MEVLFAVIGFFAALGTVLLVVWGILEVTDSGVRGVPFIVYGIASGVVCFMSFNVYATTWWSSDMTVGTVLSNDNYTMVLDSKGNTLYVCDTPAECTELKPGQHIVYEVKHTGGAFGKSHLRSVNVG